MFAGFFFKTESLNRFACFLFPHGPRGEANGNTFSSRFSLPSSLVLVFVCFPPTDLRIFRAFCLFFACNNLRLPRCTLVGWSAIPTVWSRLCWRFNANRQYSFHFLPFLKSPTLLSMLIRQDILCVFLVGQKVLWKFCSNKKESYHHYSFLFCENNFQRESSLLLRLIAPVFLCCLGKGL